MLTIPKHFYTRACSRAGCSRSVTAIIAYLVSEHNMSVPQAFLTVQNAGHKAISPNPGFGHQLLHYYYDTLHPELPKPIHSLFCKMCKFEIVADKRLQILHGGKAENNSVQVENEVVKKQDKKKKKNSSNQECEMLFIDTTMVAWPLEQGKALAAGTIKCPHCDRKLGSYHREELKCSSCKEGISPGYQVFVHRISEWKSLE